MTFNWNALLLFSINTKHCLRAIETNNRNFSCKGNQLRKIFSKKISLKNYEDHTSNVLKKADLFKNKGLNTVTVSTGIAEVISIIKTKL